MKQLLNDIDAHLDRGTLVFPSEIAAAFWRRAAILSSGRGAVREDSLISWDTFKERAFELRHDRAPVNRTIRTVFAQTLISENAKRPVLSEIVPPEFAAEAGGFTRTIEQVLPRIPAALTLLRGRKTGRLGRLRNDLEHLEQRYSAFMDEHGFFDPRWFQAAGHFRGGDYILVAPELADDFTEFAPALTHLPVIRAQGNQQTKLRVYPDSVSELRATLLTVSRLLDDGVDPEQIVLTVADFENLADRVRHEAEKYDIPVDLRAGRALADSAVGRFIRAIGRVTGSGFGVLAMEDLLLNAGIPWHNPAANALLVELGVKNGALGAAAGIDPRWRRAEREAEYLAQRESESRGNAANPGAADLLRALRKYLPRVTGAATFADLRKAFRALLTSMVDGERWLPEDERVLERSLEELRGLTAVESDTGLSVQDPYRFWLESLGEQQYVGQHRGGGVQVLAYRVGAGICPEHHFVLNATHAATSVVIRSMPFLADADRSELKSEVTDRDLSALFLETYLGSGLNVTVSAARTTFAGAAIPAGYFVSAHRLKEMTGSEHVAGDPYHAQETLGEIERPTPLQSSGAVSYQGGVRAGGPDFTHERISDSDLLELVRSGLRSTSSPGLLRLSSSQIDAFRFCPFSYLLQRALSVEELCLEVSTDDPAELGSLYHDILAGFFKHMGEEAKRFGRSELGEMRLVLSRIADDLYAQRRGMIPAVVYDAHRATFNRIVEALLENDLDLIDGHEPVLVEDWRQELESEDGYILRGRVDRATRAPDGTITLVDYKKSTLPTKKSVNAGSADALGGPGDQAAQLAVLGTAQVPLYVRLIESGGERVSVAGYYSLEKGSYMAVLDDREAPAAKPAMSRERLEEVMALTESLITSMVGRINSGDFRVNTECESCAFRTVCRTRYLVR